MARGLRVSGWFVLVAGLVTATTTVTFAQETNLRVVMNQDLKILDPIWTTAYMSRNHGYAIYDTLFALDAEQNVRPQMVESWDTSEDKLTYTFTLRDGLFWHDGPPVTSEDVIASLKRWGARDPMGQRLMNYVEEFRAVDPDTFRIVLDEPYGLVLDSLAKPSSNVPFIMPKRVAETPATEQISEYVGSGPFIFQADEWRPGQVAVYEKNPRYVPRDEPASWLAGGKEVKVDRMEWVAIPDGQTAVNALIAGEIDLIEDPPSDLLPILAAEDQIGFFDYNPLGFQYLLRFNHLHPPFDDPTVRRAALHAVNQRDTLQAVIGNPQFYRTCPSIFICATTFASEAGTEGIVESHPEEARRLLEEAGYDGTPVVLLQVTDTQVFANLAPVTKSLLERAGFTVELIPMDANTFFARRASKEPPSEGGWSAFLTALVAADTLNPISSLPVGANCEAAWFGWPCDEELENLRNQFAKEFDPAKQKELAEKVQARAMHIVTHVPMGEWFKPSAYRKDRLEGLLEAPAPIFWGVQKKT